MPCCFLSVRYTIDTAVFMLGIQCLVMGCGMLGKTGSLSWLRGFGSKSAKLDFQLLTGQGGVLFCLKNNRKINSSFKAYFSYFHVEGIFFVGAESEEKGDLK